nr:MAG TPA: hypothetical protein [Caudoviricetes sp.]
MRRGSICYAPARVKFCLKFLRLRSTYFPPYCT